MNPRFRIEFVSIWGLTCTSNGRAVSLSGMYVDSICLFFSREGMLHGTIVGSRYVGSGLQIRERQREVSSRVRYVPYDI
jgi:hypothetical protein